MNLIIYKKRATIEKIDLIGVIKSDLKNTYNYASVHFENFAWLIKFDHFQLSVIFLSITGTAPKNAIELTLNMEKTVGIKSMSENLRGFYFAFIASNQHGIADVILTRTPKNRNEFAAEWIDIFL